MPLSCMLDYALYYQALGFSVIPLRKDKKPYIQWSDYQKRRATKKEIKEWFKAYPDANIGLITGKVSGLVVVDIDKAGIDTPAYGRLGELEPTPAVSTGGGGYHLYFKHPGGKISNFQARPDMIGIDLRADGGYVVAPPSVHESGEEYTWFAGEEIDSGLELQPLPEWIYLDTPEEKDPIKVLYTGVSAGGRNQALARLAGSWVADGLSLAECLELAEIWNVKNDPPLGTGEIETTVKSIYAKHYSQYDEFSAESALQLGGDLKKLNCKVEWFVEGLIPRDSVTLLAGKGGIGKTWMMLQLANSVTKGIPFMGLKTYKGPVIYVDFENSLPVLVERIRILSADNVLFWHTTNEIALPPRLDSSDYGVYKQLPRGILIFDTLRAAHMKDENESQAMAMIMTRLKEIRDCGFTVIILHHTSKASNKVAKGSTAIVDLADQVLTLQDISTEADESRLFRLGTQDKTRYRPIQIFLKFNESGGFEQIVNKGVVSALGRKNKTL